MRIYITLSEEPVYINPFVREIIAAVPEEIVGIGIQTGKGLVAGATWCRKLEYLLTLAIISGPLHLVKRGFLFTAFHIFRKLAFLGVNNPLSICRAAKKANIPVTYCSNVNSREFIDFLKEQQVDVIINQAQKILSQEFIDAAKIGCLNRHAALLPKYRGKLAPFWAWLYGEKETGISIHFIDAQVDNGPILVQKEIPILPGDTVDSLLDKIFFEAAPRAMLEALAMIRTGRWQDCLIPNDPAKASYYSSPRLKDALHYRVIRLRRLLFGNQDCRNRKPGEGFPGKQHHDVR